MKFTRVQCFSAFIVIVVLETLACQFGWMIHLLVGFLPHVSLHASLALHLVVPGLVVAMDKLPTLSAVRHFTIIQLIMHCIYNICVNKRL